MHAKLSAADSSTLATLPGALLPLDPLELLAARAPRLANVVESVSRRRDVRALRARLLLVLLELRCPLKGRPRRSWYVPGAVARLSIEGLRRAWRSVHGLLAPCVRTLRSHLGVLERCLAIIRQPGERLPIQPEPWRGEEARGYRPRFPDTIHVLEDERAAAWWAGAGAALLAGAPRARTEPEAWRRAVGNWRRRMAAGAQGLLFVTPDDGEQGRPGGLVPSGPVSTFREGLPDREGLDAGEAFAIAERLARAGREPLALLCALRDVGAEVDGRASFEVAGEPVRLAGAAGMLARALVRGDVVRRRSAWLLRAFRHAPREELRFAAAWLSRQGAPHPCTGAAAPDDASTFEGGAAPVQPITSGGPRPEGVSRSLATGARGEKDEGERRGSPAPDPLWEGAGRFQSRPAPVNLRPAAPPLPFP